MKLNRFVRTCGVVVVWGLLAAVPAYAHGGIAGPDELGPPVITSVVLGFICYYTMIFWPSRRNRDEWPTQNQRRDWSPPRSREMPRSAKALRRVVR